VASYDEIIEGLTIIKKYYRNGYVFADHDGYDDHLLFAGGGFSDKVSVEDKARLKELGWVKNEFDGFSKSV
jgi:hypothetical protein